MAKIGSAVRDESLEFSQEISRSAEASLNPLQEDLADWISRVLDVKIPAEKFIDSLANGVLACKLAQLIQDKAVECQRAGTAVTELPQRKIRCKENASAESFFARDNVANFLQWCRTIGLEDTCLFETEGLVLKKDPKNVLVCIYELARIAGRYGIEPPGLVKLEKEIEKEQKNPRPKSSVTPSKKIKRSILDEEHKDQSDLDTNCTSDLITVEHELTDSPCHRPESQTTCIGIAHENDTPPHEPAGTPPHVTSTPPYDQLACSVVTLPVQSLAKTVDFPLEIQRISEGRYNIGGKVVFIRMLRGRHIMVRVGGGWDTLQHFLTRHEAVKTSKVDRNSIKSLDGNSVPDEFYVIQAKYKGKGEA
ncbi:growth arrest-specific protein 2-like isoform X1 [Amphiura filiformis]|uniref:growth arrest-specific protein 2-like isoform X1 n=1 Tax=Amphiura filiformis TaxID=82378 RepID=UPI003B21AFF6